MAPLLSTGEQCRRHCGRAPPLTTTLLLLLLFLISLQVVSANEEISKSKGGCGADDPSSSLGRCRNGPEAMKLKVIAIVSILAASMLGVCLPMFTRSVPALKPNSNPFVIVKAFASGVILATGYMHVLPDSFEYLNSDCLPADPWAKFPFTTFIAMLSAVATQMVDSFAMSYYRKLRARTSGSGTRVSGQAKDGVVAAEDGRGNGLEHVHGGPGEDHLGDGESQLLRHRVVAQVLELGIVVHSVVIGLSMGASDNACTIKSLVAALCFHQLFEGMGLGGCILQGEFGLKVKAIMVFFFSITTPLGIVLGIGLSNVYSESSPTALIVVGLLNACSAGLLNYMALVDLIALDFMGPKLQGSMKLQVFGYGALLLGAGGMSLMAKWA
ncbi:fe(2+) transport protein 1-like [Punica granatum]|uniref:Fe(2+) transport protein 1-like n=1 Tax=Punica granatum TaxID=22663 RepID=A0A6P8CBL6_PUNGR|nr:fe(2+) transport protein 1-like [Punica granatum]